MVGRALRRIWVVVCIGSSVAAVTAAESSAFRSAKPVWLAGRETEMNLTAGFRAVIEAPADKSQKVVLRVAAATIYRAWLNGEFLGCGPARGPHGYFRVDEWDLSPKLAKGKNLVAIEVAGYNCNSYYLLDQPSFCQAEVTASNRVLASTAGEGVAFAAQVLDYRVQKVQRYSFQRPFVEVYQLRPGSNAWLMQGEGSASSSSPFSRRFPDGAQLPLGELAAQPPKHLLPRNVLYSGCALKQPLRLVSVGRVERREKIDNLWKDRSLVDIAPKLKGYPESQLAVIPSLDMQWWTSTSRAAREEPWTTTRLAEKAFAIADFGANVTGFLGATLKCEESTWVAFTFDEILTDGDVDFKRLGCANVLTFFLEPGEYRVESIEPYTLRYLKALCPYGSCRVENLHLREYAHPQPKVARFHASDERLNRLFAAGVLTFRQNALDIFMDCPSRERAGWLCDSFFTSRVAADLTGGTPIEHNFLENFMLPEKFAHLPDGMLPMCYPADHYDGVYIPNWAMWLVVELEEYLGRSGDRATVDGLRPKVLRLLDFFKKYENSDGLLEKLPSWVFVEWSKANDFVQDVNYPSNMLYAGTLAAAGRMYGRPDLVAKASKLRQTIRGQSFDGHFFVDNALRRNGKLQVTRNRSEVCQYFAFFFGVADRKTHAELWRVLRDEFGPNREKTKAHAEVHPANSFIGNMLRMELLSDAGRGQQILDESVAYLLYMAERTGTLWENVGAYASCNHGFASHICHTLYRDILGVRRVDPIAKQITVRFQDLKLEGCEGTVPTRDGPVTLGWSARQNQLQYRLTHPAGYQATIENLSGKPLKRLAQ
jgi:alpha-L-rhamnosidase